MTADELVSRLATEIESLQKQLTEMKNKKNGTITERLASVKVRVKPLAWRKNDNPRTPTWKSAKLNIYYQVTPHGRQDVRGDYSAYICILEDKEVAVGTAEHCIAACESNHAEAVMRLLEII